MMQSYGTLQHVNVQCQTGAVVASPTFGLPEGKALHCTVR